MFMLLRLYHSLKLHIWVIFLFIWNYNVMILVQENRDALCMILMNGGNEEYISTPKTCSIILKTKFVHGIHSDFKFKSLHYGVISKHIKLLNNNKKQA